MATAKPVAISSPAAFVGRSIEMRTLLNELTATRSGQPRVVLLEGDPGIGKTRLARELGRQAEAAGARSLFGRFLDDGAVPYLAFTTALVPELDRLGKLTVEEVGPGANALRVLSGLAGLARPVPEQPGALVQAIIRGTFALAADAPLLFVIDDLQWAEAQALEAFLHLALAISDTATQRGSRIALVGIHRPVEAEEPLGKALARIRREAGVRTIRVEGLDELGLSDLVRSATSTRCSSVLLASLQEATAGNPLFVLESLRALSALGVLSLEQGFLNARVDPAQLPLPAEVMAAIRARVKRIEKGVLRTLGIAALLGDEFTAHDLEVATAATLDEMQAHIDVGCNESVLGEYGAESYRFAHPLLRRACHDTLSSQQRRRLHRDIANRFIAAEGEPISPLVVAHHLVGAGPEANQALVGPFCREASQLAYSANAWNESARYAEAALAAPGFIESLSPADRAALYSQAGEAHHRAMDFTASRQRFLLATAIYEELGDIDRWASSLVGWGRSGAVQTNEPLDTASLEQFLAAAGEGHDAARAEVLSFWAELLFVRGSPEAVRVAGQARDLAVRAESWTTAAQACTALGSSLLRAMEPKLALASFDEAVAIATRTGDPWHLGWAYPRQAMALLAFGRLEEATIAIERGLEVTERIRDFAELSLVLAVKVCLLVAKGELDEAEETASRAQSAIDYSGYAWSAPFLYAPLVQARLLRGRPREAADALELLGRSVGPPAAWLLRLLLPPYATVETVREALGQYPARAAWMTDLPDVLALGVAGSRAVVSHFVGESAPSGTLDILARATTSGLRLSLSPPLFLERLTASSLAFSAPADEAVAALEAAASTADLLGLPIERALCDLALARLLAQRASEGDRERAGRLIAAVTAVARERGLAGLQADAAALATANGFSPGAALSTAAYPNGLSELEYDVLAAMANGLSGSSLERALLVSSATREQVERSLIETAGVHGPADALAFLARVVEELLPDVMVSGEAIEEMATSGLRAFMFTDVVGSTPLQLALGDATYARLLQLHDRSTRMCIRDAGGKEVKRTGDGFFASFRDGTSAVRCARDIQTLMPLALPDHPDQRLMVRIGVHVGEAVEMGEDLFGIAVSTAARICARGQAGDILISDPTRSSVAAPGVEFHRYGRFALKGLTERMTLYRVAV